MKWNSKKILLMICVGLAGGALFSFNKGDDRNFQIDKKLGYLQCDIQGIGYVLC